MTEMNLDKITVRVKTRDDYFVRIRWVNGPEVRKVHPDFNNMSWNNHHDFVPEQEIWIDDTQDISDTDIELFIARAHHELRVLDDTDDSQDAFEAGERWEKAARKKMALDAGGVLKLNKKKIMVIKGMKEHSVMSLQKAVTVYRVNHEAVKQIMPSFTMGGHSKVYDFIDPFEIWVSDELGSEETKKTLNHEYVEYVLMTMGVSYDDAHEVALRAEAIFSYNLQ